MKKKMLLVYPLNYSKANVDMDSITSLTGKAGAVLTASLPTVAALTPTDKFDISMIDESIEPLNFDYPYDLVGITGFPTQLGRAREVAEEFRKRGVPVICGGPAASVSPERWRDFADVLIIGEAERIWPEFLKDFLAGDYKDEYREMEKFDLDISPVPNYSYLSKKTKKQFMMGIVQTSRGCPFDCEFCNVVVYVGHKMRYKPVATIMKEVQQIYDMGIRIIALADDNFPAGRKKAKEILRALRDWNWKQKSPVSFFSQFSIDTAQDEEFMELSAEAGLSRMVVGIETSNAASLKETGKTQNLKRSMHDDIKTFNQHGFVIATGCLVGFDNDDLSIFQHQFDFFMQTGIPGVHVYPLQALDGTRLKTRLIKEGRYIDWEKGTNKDAKYSNVHNTFTVIPKQMTNEQLTQGIYWLAWNLYKTENFIKRVQILFDDFESSPKKDTLKICKPSFNIKTLGLAFRFAKYYFTKATPDEKSILRRLIKMARNSSHPNSLVISIVAFLLLINMRTTLLNENSDIANITYPE